MKRITSVYYKNNEYIEALETLMDDYSEFILNPIYEQQFNAWRDVEESTINKITAIYYSAVC